MAVRGTRETSSNHFNLLLILIVVAIAVYMYTTGTKDPIQAIKGFTDMILGWFPPEIANALQQVIDAFMNAFKKLVRELEDAIR